MNQAEGFDWGYVEDLAYESGTRPEPYQYHEPAQEYARAASKDFLLALGTSATVYAGVEAVAHSPAVGVAAITSGVVASLYKWRSFLENSRQSSKYNRAGNIIVSREMYSFAALSHTDIQQAAGITN